MNSSVLLQAAGAVLLADFVSGVVHWAEDAYARKDTPIVGKWIGEANLEHHSKPRAFVTRSWWASSWDLVLTSMLVVAGAWWLKALTWQVWLFATVSANANQIHKWAHSAPHENGRVVTGLAERGVTRLAAGRKVAGDVALLPLAEIGMPVLAEFAAPKGWSF